MEESKARRSTLGSRALEVTEEVAVGRNHDHVAFPAQRRAVGLQAAPERVELLVPVVRRRVEARGRGLALAADALRVGVGLGDDLGALAFGGGADGLRLAVALAALR